MLLFFYLIHGTILTTTNDVAKLITCAFNSFAALNDNSLAMIERSVPLITTTDIMIDYCVGELLHSPTDYFIYSNAAKRLALLILSSIDLRTESLNLLGKSKDSSIDNQ